MAIFKDVKWWKRSIDLNEKMIRDYETSIKSCRQAIRFANIKIKALDNKK